MHTRAVELHNLQALAKRNATGYDLERDHEEALRDAAALDATGKRTAKDTCPDCGWLVINWYSPNNRDPGDVDPRADCTNPDCGWGY